MFHKVKILLYLFLLITVCGPGIAEGDTVIRPVLDIGLQFDSNTSISAEGEGVKQDFALTVIPSIELVNQRSDNLRLDGSYRAIGRFYLTQSNQNSIAHNASIGMAAQFSPKTNFTASDSVTFTKESLDASTVGIQTQRNNIVSNTASLSLGHVFTPRFSASIGFSDSITKFQNPDLIDSRSDSASVSGVYNLTENTSLNASYTFRNYSFQGDGTDNYVISHSLQAGFNSHITPTLAIELSGGSTYIPKIEENGQFIWIAHAGVTKTLYASTLNFDFARSVTTTSGLTSEVSINNRYSLQLNVPLGQYVSVAVFGSYTQNRSRPTETVDINSYTAGINGDWRVNSWLTLGAQYSHFKQLSSGTEGADITREVAGVNATFYPGEWRI